MNGKKKILLVADETLIRSYVQELLSASYEVLSAKDGIEGVYCFVNHADEIAAVITDWEMPRMDGEQLIECLRHRNPGLPFVLMSGYMQDDRKSDFAAAFEGEGVAVLWKPFEGSQLRALLTRLIYK